MNLDNNTFSNILTINFIRFLTYLVDKHNYSVSDKLVLTYYLLI